MKYIYLLVLSLGMSSTSLFAIKSPIQTFVCENCRGTKTPLVSYEYEKNFRKKSDVAQYKGSDYANVVHVARNITLEDAFDIANSSPEIDYFVFTKGYQMVLEVPEGVEVNPEKDPHQLLSNVDYQFDSGELGYGYCRIFRRGDTVFFAKDGLWLGSAPGLADAYFKE